MRLRWSLDVNFHVKIRYLHLHYKVPLTGWHVGIALAHRQWEFHH